MQFLFYSMTIFARNNFFYLCPLIFQTFAMESQIWKVSKLKKEILYTRTAGAYGPLVLAPAEGVGALRAPCQVWQFF